MSKARKGFWMPLLFAALLLLLSGCAADEAAGPVQEAGPPEQPDRTLPAEGDPGYSASILISRYWGEGVVLEGSPESGYLLAGFNVPAGTPLYAPFDGITEAVALEPYDPGDTKSYAGRSLCTPGSLNGFSAYNVTAVAEGSVKKGDLFAEVASEEYIFPGIYSKVNLILEFNLFDGEVDGYEQMEELFRAIFENILEEGAR